MSDADWDADDFDPTEVTKAAVKPASAGAWAGEDEEDEVKEAWDKSDASSGEDTDPERPKAVQRKKKKKLIDIIAEKEATKVAELEARAAEAAAQKQMNTPEARMAEKLRLQKMEENSNLQLAKEMMGLKVGSIDAIVPVEKSEFEQFDKALVDKITLYSESVHYPDFLENLIKNLCLDQSAATVKKIKMSVEALQLAKAKEEKSKTKKTVSKKAGTIRMDTNKDIYSGGAEYDDLDDFM